MSENEKKITPEFIQNVKKWLEIDDKIKEIRSKTKNLTTEKKEREAYILDYLATIEENIIDVHDGKLKRNVSKTQAPFKKETIHQALTEITGDASKASAMTEHIIKSRPIVERVNLKRTRSRNNDKAKE